MGLEKNKATLNPDAVPTLFTKQVTSKRSQRPRQERKDTHFRTPSANLEAILSGKITEECTCGQLLLLCVCYAHDISYHDIMQAIWKTCLSDFGKTYKVRTE